MLNFLSQSSVEVDARIFCKITGWICAVSFEHQSSFIFTSYCGIINGNEEEYLKKLRPHHGHEASIFVWEAAFSCWVVVIELYWTPPSSFLHTHFYFYTILWQQLLVPVCIRRCISLSNLQAQLLEEAKETERLNLASLQKYEQFELERKKKRERANVVRKLKPPFVSHVDGRDGKWIVVPEVKKFQKPERKVFYTFVRCWNQKWLNFQICC